MSDKDWHRSHVMIQSELSGFEIHFLNDRLQHKTTKILINIEKEINYAPNILKSTLYHAYPVMLA